MHSQELAHPSLQPQQPLPTWLGASRWGQGAGLGWAQRVSGGSSMCPLWARRQPAAPVTGGLLGRALAPCLAGCARAEGTPAGPSQLPALALTALLGTSLMQPGRAPERWWRGRGTGQDSAWLLCSACGRRCPRWLGVGRGPGPSPPATPIESGPVQAAVPTEHPAPRKEPETQPARGQQA